MRPKRWIMRVLRASGRPPCPCALLLLAYLALFGLIAVQLSLVESTATQLTGISMETGVSRGPRKRSDPDEDPMPPPPPPQPSPTPGSGAPARLRSPSAADHGDGQPYFDNGTAANVTVQIANVAYLHCRVRQLGDKVVSWLRRRDYHILTVGLHTYSNDQRFQMIHQDQDDDWTLQIKFTQGRDAGIYECQISSDPPISHLVLLNVVVAKAEIVGSADMYFKSGSTITLTCLISQSPEPPSYVFWYHDNRMINFDQIRGGIRVTTNKSDVTTSHLVIGNAQKSDSGNYTCDPSNAEPTSVTVHVLNGEKPEAIQHDAKTSGSESPKVAAHLLGLMILLLASFILQHAR